MVYGYLRGVDDRKLEPHKERKSISAEMNVSSPIINSMMDKVDDQYGIRFRNQEQAEICIRDLSAEVAKRLKQVNAKGRLLTLKLMSRHPDAPIEPPKVSPSSSMSFSAADK
jgi:DNA repair protein REV1